MNLNELAKTKNLQLIKPMEIVLTEEEKFSQVDVKYVASLISELNKTENIYNFEDKINDELKRLKRKLLNNNINDIDINSKAVIQEVFMKTKNFNISNKGFFSKFPILRNIISEGKNIINKLQLEYASFTKLVEEVENKLQENKKQIIISLQENEGNNQEILDAYKKTSSYLVAYQSFLKQKTDELIDFQEKNKNIQELIINSEIMKRQNEIEYLKSREHFFSEEKIKILDRVFDLQADLAVKTNILNYIKDFLSHGIEDFYRLIENLIKIEQNRKNLQYNEDLDKTYKDLYRFAKEKGLENLVKSEEGQINFSLGYDMLHSYHLKQEEAMNQVYNIRGEKARIRDEEVIKYQSLEKDKLELLRPKIIKIDGLNI